MACKNCNLVKCGCADSYLTTPAPCPTPSDCPDVQPCSEVFDSQCVVYTGDDLLCDTDTVVLQNSTVHTALEAIVAYFCANAGQAPAKEIFYQEQIDSIDIVDAANWPVGLLNPDNYFHPDGYETLSYTNTSGQTKTYKVHASWEMEAPSGINGSDFKNWVDGAIIKTVSAVDTIEYEASGNLLINGFLFEGPNNTDVLNASSVNKLYSDAELGGVQTFQGAATPGTGYTNPGATNVATSVVPAGGTGLTVDYVTDGFGVVTSVTINQHGSGYSFGDTITILDGNNDATVTVNIVTDSIEPLEFRLLTYKYPYNRQIFKLITLQDNETISLQFKSKTDGVGWLTKAQLMVEEF